MSAVSCRLIEQFFKAVFSQLFDSSLHGQLQIDVLTEAYLQGLFCFSETADQRLAIAYDGASSP